MNHVSRDCTCQHQCRKKLNQNIKMSIVFLFISKGRPLWLVSFFTKSFQGVGKVFLSFYPSRWNTSTNKIWRQYFLEIRVDGQLYDNQTNKKIKNIENSYNSGGRKEKDFRLMTETAEASALFMINRNSEDFTRILILIIKKWKIVDSFPLVFLVFLLNGFT